MYSLLCQRNRKCYIADKSLSDILLNKDVISWAINEMSTNSAAGPDGMPASLSKECRDELCILLQI